MMLDKAEKLSDELVRLRRTIHANPELSFQEFQTAALVTDTLSEIGGYTIHTQVGKTGVMAELGDSGPIIAIRADMDALPIIEANDVPYASKNPGVMHACGHDAHTAILLASPIYCAKVTLRSSGRVAFDSFSSHRRKRPMRIISVARRR